MWSFAPLWFLTYELVILFTCIRIIFLVTARKGCRLNRAEHVSLLLASTIVLSSSFAAIMSFNQYNYSQSYWAISLGVLLLVHIDHKKKLAEYKDYLVKTFVQLTGKIQNSPILLAYIIIIPPIIWGIRPIDETDSLFALNYMFNWMANTATPYDNQAYFVAFWELAYLPAMVITNSDQFFWVTSLKAFFLFGLSLFLVGTKIQLPRRLIYPSILSSLLLIVIWNNPSGIPTLKNDLLFASGVILIAFSILKNISEARLGRMGIIFFVLGNIFVSTKYFGLAIMLLSLISLIIINHKRIQQINRKNAICIIASIVIAIAVTGHYYIYHYLEFGNPFYPHMFTILGYGFTQGGIDFPNTSILSSISNPDLYTTVLFEPSFIYSTGLLFPIILVFGVIGTLVIIAYHFYRHYNKKSLDLRIIFLSAYIFFTWIIYFWTSLSAHATPGDFFYIKSLNSLRYVEGTLALTELFFIYILWKSRIPSLILIGLIATSALTRFLKLYGLLPSYIFEYNNITYLALSVVILVLALYRIKDIRIKSVVLSAIILSIILASPVVVEKNREGWAWWWHATIMTIHNLPPANIYLISEDPRIATQYSWPTKYPIIGSNFQHTITTLKFDEIITKFEQATESDKDMWPEYIVQLCNPNLDCTEALDKVSLSLKKFGYEQVNLDKHSLLMKLS